MTEIKVALVVRGGWDGHEPVETTESVMPFLSAQGFEIRVEEGTAVYADEEFMSSVDLIVQVNTMNTIADKELAGLTRAVIGGAGLAGWHGGIADSYRNSADYLQLIGGQFAHHAAVPQEERTGQQSDHYLDFTVNIVDARREHPIVAGIEDFDLHTEQYWVLSDAYNDVLATTQIVHRPFDAWNRAFTVPVVWTRLWGAGRVFVCTAGHKLDILNEPPVRTIVERGLLWASR
jgi:type 1 glutamine amidotransferase